MSSFNPDRAAEAIALARAARRRLAPLPTGIAPSTPSEGAAVQVALARRLGAMPPAGFKIGATAKRMQDYLGLVAPVAGFIPVAGLHRSGASLPFADFLNPGAECEIVVRLARDIAAGPCTPDQAAAAVEAVFAGIEIVENRYEVDPAVIGVPTLMADQVYHAACIAGAPRTDWRSLNIASLAGRMWVDGRVVGEGVAGDLLEHPWNCLAWLAGSAEIAAFGGLRAGQTIMLGSVTPPIWLDQPPPDRSSIVKVAFANLTPVELELHNTRT